MVIADDKFGLLKCVLACFSTVMAGMLFLLIFLAAVRTIVGEDAQVPLASSLRSDAFQSDTYKFEWPVHKIAIIGAGPGCVVLQSKHISTIHLDVQWTHCLSGVR